MKKTTIKTNQISTEEELKINSIYINYKFINNNVNNCKQTQTNNKNTIINKNYLLSVKTEKSILQILDEYDEEGEEEEKEAISTISLNYLLKNKIKEFKFHKLNLKKRKNNFFIFYDDVIIVSLHNITPTSVYKSILNSFVSLVESNCENGLSFVRIEFKSWQMCSEFSDLFNDARVSEDLNLFVAEDILKKVEDLTFNDCIKFDSIKFEDMTDLNLYEYQKKSVAWMLRREGVIVNRGDREEVLNLYDKIELTLSSNEIRHFYYNPHIQHLTADSSPDLTYPKGGILAEEMGLGKSIEVLLLILLHTRETSTVPKNNPVKLAPEVYSKPVLPIKTTLIIAPNMIIQQWLNELNKLKTPLKSHVYQDKDYKNLSPKDLQEFDLVFCDFETLRKEVYFARSDHPRSRRYERADRCVSTLVTVEFWRVVVDEAQMIENGHVLAGEITRKISRVNTWVVTGTPIVKQTTPLIDLTSLFAQININKAYPLQNLYNLSTDDLFHLLGSLMRRNTRSQVTLPKNYDCLHVLKFTKIERDYYLQCCKEFKESVMEENAEGGEDILNVPLSTYNHWFLILRQCCVHVQLGQHNQQRLGGKHKSLDGLLKIMQLQMSVSYYHVERRIVDVLFERGLVFEKIGKRMKAIVIYEGLVETVKRQVNDFNELLEYMIEDDGEEEEEDDEEKDEDNVEKIIRKNIEACHHLLHKILYSVASVWLNLSLKDEEEDADKMQVDDKEELTDEERTAFKDKSDGLFEEAEQLRQDMTKVVENSLRKTVDSLKIESEYNFGLEIIKYRHLGNLIFVTPAVENINELLQYLNSQIIVIRDLRGLIINQLINQVSLHTDYGKDMRVQEVLIRSFDRLKALVILRKALIIEETDDETEAFLDKPDNHGKLADSYENEEPFEGLSEESLKLLEIKIDDPIPYSTLQLQLIKLSDVYGIESKIAKKLHKFLKIVIKEQQEFFPKIERDINLISKAINKRIEFYRIIQRLGDNVVLPEFPNPERALDNLAYDEEKLRDKLEKERKEVTYLKNLEVDYDCVICMDEIKEMVITDCAHVFCRNCLKMWMNIHWTCPICKKHLDKENIQAVSNARLEDMKMNTKKTKSNISRFTGSTEEEKNAKLFLPEIVDKDLVNKYGIKIGTVLSHIVYLDKTDREFKGIIFSQWNEVLALFQKALNELNIQIGRIYARKNFRDPETKIFLLNTKSQNAGLTLTECYHVFLCDPCVNAFELQAIGRVRRVGQNKKTFVHRYIVEDSVEELIFERKEEDVVGMMQEECLRLLD